MNHRTKIVFILGPTGSGKSKLALRLAQKTSGVIINLDSVQAYEGLEIGSASPKSADKALVAHFLYNVIKPPSVTTAGEFRRLALEVIEQEKAHTDFFFVVSGNGFYTRVLERGTYPIPKADPQAQAQVWQELKKPGGEERLYLELKEKDPLTARRFSAKDHYRLVRALEIIRSVGKPLSLIEREFQDSLNMGLAYPYIKIGVGAPAQNLSAESCLLSESARAWLRAQLSERVDKMFQEGFVAEVQNLLGRGLSPDWHPLKSAGYAQLIEELVKHGANFSFQSREQELKAKVLQAHLKIAKKQRTWFAHEPGITWLDASQVDRAYHIVMQSHYD